MRVTSLQEVLNLTKRRKEIKWILAMRLVDLHTLVLDLEYGTSEEDLETEALDPKLTGKYAVAVQEAIQDQLKQELLDNEARLKDLEITLDD